MNIEMKAAIYSQNEAYRTLSNVTPNRIWWQMPCPPAKFLSLELNIFRDWLARSYVNMSDKC
jgi:hypothetical protein